MGGRQIWSLEDQQTELPMCLVEARKWSLCPLYKQLCVLSVLTTFTLKDSSFFCAFFSRMASVRCFHFVFMHGVLVGQMEGIYSLETTWCSTLVSCARTTWTMFGTSGPLVPTFLALALQIFDWKFRSSFGTCAPVYMRSKLEMWFLYFAECAFVIRSAGLLLFKGIVTIFRVWVYCVQGWCVCVCVED